MRIKHHVTGHTHVARVLHLRGLAEELYVPSDVARHVPDADQLLVAALPTLAHISHADNETRATLLNVVPRSVL